MKGNDGMAQGWEGAFCVLVAMPRPGDGHPVAGIQAEPCQPQRAALTTEPRARDDLHQIPGPSLQKAGQPACRLPGISGQELRGEGPGHWVCTWVAGGVGWHAGPRFPRTLPLLAL